MKVRFWGVRGSLPSPLPPAEVLRLIAAPGGDGAQGQRPRTVGGNTSCVSVEADGQAVILDAGSGLRDLGREMMSGAFGSAFGSGGGTAHLFISHTHWDHIQGFPYFTPAFVKGNVIHIYGGHEGMRRRFREQQRPDFFPVPLKAMPATLVFHQMQPGRPVDVGSMAVTCLPLPHPGGSFAYRLRSREAMVVYASDGEYTHRFDNDDAEAPHLYGLDVENYVSFFRNTDLLIFDAMFDLHESIARGSWGHSTALIGADLATRARVRRLVLFHHDHAASDDAIWSFGEIARRAAAMDPRHPNLDVQVAYEGMEIVL